MTNTTIATIRSFVIATLARWEVTGLDTFCGDTAYSLVTMIIDDEALASWDDMEAVERIVYDIAHNLDPQPTSEETTMNHEHDHELSDFAKQVLAEDAYAEVEAAEHEEMMMDFGPAPSAYQSFDLEMIEEQEAEDRRIAMEYAEDHREQELADYAASLATLSNGNLKHVVYVAGNNLHKEAIVRTETNICFLQFELEAASQGMVDFDDQWREVFVINPNTDPRLVADYVLRDQIQPLTQEFGSSDNLIGGLRLTYGHHVPMISVKADRQNRHAKQWEKYMTNFDIALETALISILEEELMPVEVAQEIQACAQSYDDVINMCCDFGVEDTVCSRLVDIIERVL